MFCEWETMERIYLLFVNYLHKKLINFGKSVEKYGKTMYNIS